MPGIGNDIVALSAIDVERTNQYRFFSKIIVGQEQQLYNDTLASALAFEHFVWLAWSMKESAYKCMQRYQHNLVFSPSNVLIGEVQLPANNAKPPMEGIGFDNLLVCKSQLNFRGQHLFSRSIITAQYIVSVVNDTNDFSNTCWRVKKIGSNDTEDQSLAVRDMLLHKLHELYPADEFKIEKSIFGFPVLLKNGAEADFPVTFAHHDHYAGYAFIPDI